MKGKFLIKPCNHGRSKYVVEGYLDGFRKREFFRTKAEAQVACEARNIELSNHGTKLAGMDSSLRAEAIACSERLARLGVSLTTAVDYYCAQFDLRAKSVLFEFAWKECKNELERRLAANEISARHYWTMGSAGRKLTTAHGDKHLCDITPLFLKTWLLSLNSSKSGLPLSPTTRNNILTNLSGIFTFAIERGWITSNPCAEIESFNDRRIKAEKEPGIVTPEEAATLLENADHEILPFYAIGLFAGLRVAELTRLQWSNVDFESKRIDCNKRITKTGQSRWVPMSENLLAWLEPYRNATGPVVPPDHWIRTKQTRAVAGISWDDKHNALRHSYCSYTLAASQNEAQTAFTAGHSVKVLRENYTNRVKPEAAFRYFSIVPAPEAQNIFAIA